MIFLPERPASTPATTDYTTQGDPNQDASPSPKKVQQQNNANQYITTNNYFIPDGSNRHIHDIKDKVFHAGYLKNGNNAYLLQLPKLQDMGYIKRWAISDFKDQHPAYNIRHKLMLGRMTSFRRSQCQRLSSTNPQLSALTDQQTVSQ